jgi:hypothetical protein
VGLLLLFGGGAAPDPLELALATSGARLSAPGSPPLVSVYDRSGTLLSDPWALTEKITGLKYSSVVPGGFELCSFSVPQRIARELVQAEAYRVVVRCGMAVAWDGRIGDISRKGDTRIIQAFGCWEHLSQRRSTLTAAAGEAGDDLLMRLLPDAPLVSTKFNDIGDPNFDLGGKSWERADFQTIVKDIMDAGDDQTPPRVWYFNLWEVEDVPSTGAYAGSVNASADDAYDDANGHVQTSVGTTFQVGKNADGDALCAGFIFPAVDIDRYAHITSATLSLYSLGMVAGAAGNLNLRVYGEDVATPADFTVEWPRDKTPLTAAYTAWTPAAWNAGNWYTVDVTAIVQEIVNRADWVTGNEICILVKDQATTFVARGQGEAWDHADAHQATLDVDYAPPSGQTYLAFHAEFIPRPEMTLANVDYLLTSEYVEGEVSVTPSLEELANSVVARYGAGPSYTAAAEDADSIDLYDKRENDPEALDAGDTAVVAQANNVRDMYLEAHKGPVWKATDVTVRRLRGRWGSFVNPACVRAGCVVRFGDLVTMNENDTRIFYIVRAEYSADSKTLVLSPEMPPDTLEVFLQRLQEKE